MQKHWTIKKQGDIKAVKNLSAELNITNTLSNLLVQKGIDNFEKAEAFFCPKLEHLDNPFLIKDMDKAIERIDKAIENKEKILIYGDYDVDGTTAVALIYSFFRDTIHYDNIKFYIPDRYTEGYGISIQGVDFAEKNNISLIIALDCGIKANAKVNYAGNKNIDFIICDHHEPGNELPKAIAVLDSKRADCNYPYKELSGCGVGFKLIQAYSQKHNIPFQEIEQYLDLVVVSIASDIVPITGENRILAYYGLKQLNTKPRQGFEAIIKYCGITKKNTFDTETIFDRKLIINDLVFLIGPRINAAGRIESGRLAVELLISKEIEQSMELAKHINIDNTKRKELDIDITNQALDMIKNDKQLLNAKTTVVFNPDWHKGVIGIVASRLIEVYYRPTIVLTESNGLITGSARSVKKFNLYNAINECSNLLENFGGHKYAAGLSLKPENFNAFRKNFEDVVCNTIEDDMLIPEIKIDAKIDFDEITPTFFRILKRFAPFGPGNMSPVFQTDSVIDNGNSYIVGKNHLKLSVSKLGNTKYFKAIAFQQANVLKDILKKKSFNICYSLKENIWNGTTSLQLNVKDIN